MSGNDELTALKLLARGRDTTFVASALGLTPAAVLDLAARAGATRSDGTLDLAAVAVAVAYLEAGPPPPSARAPASAAPPAPAAPPRPAPPPPGAGRRPLGGFALIDVALIDTDGRNVRDDLGDLSGLAASIRAEGILQPLTVTTNGTRFVLVYGHRRLGAACLVGLTQVPCIVRAAARDDTSTRIARLIENLHRKDLEPLEEATQYRLLVQAGLDQRDIARRVGVSQSTVSTRLLLLELPPDAQAMVRDKRLPLIEATALARQVRDKGSGTVRHGAPVERDYWASHALADEVRQRCGHHGRRQYGRLGCGACWEAVIRGDEGLRLLVHRQPHGAEGDRP